MNKVKVNAENPPTISNNTFSNCSNELTIHVPAESLEAYKAADYWRYLNINAEADSTPYLTFNADAAQSLTMSRAVNTLEYSVNGGEWKELGTNTVEFGGQLGDLRLRGKSSFGTAENSENYSQFIFGNNTSVSCNGDIRTLIDYKDPTNANTSNARFCKLFYKCTTLTTAPILAAMELADHCYYYMFSGCSSLTTAPTLPATELADYCYSHMFSHSTSITTAPELQASKLTDSCYGNMFNGCTGLTTAPTLPAMELANYCYYMMFFDCINLKTAPLLPANKLKNSCYAYMFHGCKSLTTTTELPATTLEDYCYQAMFGGCNSLTTAPILSASTLKKSCYSRMFSGCKKLNQIVMLATDISADNCLSEWVYDVSPSGTFIKAKNMNTLSIGTSGIPNSFWNIENYSEE